MSVILEQYKDRVDRVWYDSSNVVYSECYDYENSLKDLKIVFKEGRTYLYKEVDVNDYVLFKRDLSQGKALNKYIVKKYKGMRLSDIDLTELEALKESIIKEKNEESNVIQEGTTSDTSLNNGHSLYHIILNPSTNEVSLTLEGNEIFNGVNKHIDIFELMKALSIKCSVEEKEN